VPLDREEVAQGATDGAERRRRCRPTLSGHVADMTIADGERGGSVDRERMKPKRPRSFTRRPSAAETNFLSARCEMRHGRWARRLTEYEFSGTTRANARVVSAATRG
jgi:hypothetical protein